MPDPPAAPSRIPRARLEDVARAAGVSKSTVSRVLSGDATLSVRDETRERVRALAQELGYRPHPVARALATPATGALALLVPTLSNPAYVEILRGAYHRARERGYVLLCAEDFEDQEADEAFTELVEGGRVDGLLIASARPENRLLDALERHWVPHVFVNRSVPGARANVTLERIEQPVLRPRGGDQQAVHAAAFDQLRERLVGLLVLEVLRAQEHVATLAGAVVGAAEDLDVGGVGESRDEQRERPRGRRAGDSREDEAGSRAPGPARARGSRRGRTAWRRR